MNIINQDPTFQLTFVPGMVKDIGSTYLRHLNNKLHWEMKVNYLEVIIRLSMEETTGHFWSEVLENRINILLCINPRHSKKYIAFIIAHEMAHMFMCELSDVLNVSGKASAVERTNQDQSYGLEMEELLADYIAHYIVSKTDYEDENGQYEKYRQENSVKYDFVAAFESYFGKSLMKSDYIDYTVQNDDFFEEGICVYNPFWYSISTNTFDTIIRKFNKTMKKSIEDVTRTVNPNEMILRSKGVAAIEAYKGKMENVLDKHEQPYLTLCKKVEKLFNDQSDQNVQKDIAIMLEMGCGV